jgi:ammonium transporter, Amt family
VIGRRNGWPHEQARPHNLPTVMLGTGILWFGWFDVVAVHGVGGVTGLLATGLLVTTIINSSGANGLLYGGGFTQLGRQALAAAVAVCYAFALISGPRPGLIAWALDKTIGLRVAPHHELAGIDEAEHAETAYEHGRPSGHFAGSLSRVHSAGHH